MSLSSFRVTVDDEATFSTRRIERLRHDFHQHPLMQMDALAALARELAPTGQTRYIRPGTTQKSAFDHDAKSPDGRSVEQVFAEIETPGSWVALYNVETVPRYADFIAEVIGSVKPLIEREDPGIFMMTGFIFISAPPSVTPFHIDRENNFWLQIHGRKLMSVWDHRDRVAVSGKDVEDFIIYRALEKVRLSDAARPRAHDFDVGPGDGVYFPATSPHMTRSDPDWVRPGDGVSVSIGVTFYTETTRKEAHTHQVNEVLRRFGMNPSIPDGSVLDAVKAPLGKLIGAARYKRRKQAAPPGF